MSDANNLGVTPGPVPFPPLYEEHNLATDAPDLSPSQRAEAVYQDAVGYLQGAGQTESVNKLAASWVLALDAATQETVAVAASVAAIAYYEGTPGAPPLPPGLHATTAQREYTSSPVAEAIKGDVAAVAGAAKGAYAWFKKEAAAAEGAVVNAVAKPVIRGLWWTALAGGAAYLIYRAVTDDEACE